MTLYPVGLDYKFNATLSFWAAGGPVTDSCRQQRRGQVSTPTSQQTQIGEAKGHHFRFVHCGM